MQHPGLGGPLPIVLQVRHPAGYKDEVNRAIANHLVSDVDVAALGVPGLRLHAPPPRELVRAYQAGQRTSSSVRRLLLREARERPVLVIFEDLHHWIDGETEALLDG